MGRAYGPAFFVCVLRAYPAFGERCEQCVPVALLWGESRCAALLNGRSTMC